MYLISLNLKFETKVLDIAYLLMLKMMKEPGFQIDGPFVRLHIKILTKQDKFKDAIEFIDRKSELFQDRLERSQLEAKLYLLSNSHINCINVYYNVLRLNNSLAQYTEMWQWYKEVIAIICDDFLAKQRKYELRANFDQRIEQMDMKN